MELVKPVASDLRATRTWGTTAVAAGHGLPEFRLASAFWCSRFAPPQYWSWSFALERDCAGRLHASFARERRSSTHQLLEKGLIATAHGAFIVMSHLDSLKISKSPPRRLHSLLEPHKMTRLSPDFAKLMGSSLTYWSSSAM